MIKPRIHFDGVMWICRRHSRDWAEGCGETPELAYVEFCYYLGAC